MTSPADGPFCFRVRLKLCGEVSIDSQDSMWDLSTRTMPGAEVQLQPLRTTTFEGARELSLTGRPFASEDEADRACKCWMDALRRGFATARLGADFGDRAATGVLTEHGATWFESQIGQRVLNDTHGGMVYPCEPVPRFASFNASVTTTRAAAAVRDALSQACAQPAVLSSQVRLAYDLFSASFNDVSPDARFMTLMMAVETLIEPLPREDSVVSHVNKLIALTQQAGLTRTQSDSLIGGLRQLRDESIGQAGQRLSQARLGDAEYGDQPAPRFFIHCYGVRSNLAHGADPRPSWEQVNGLVGPLESYVQDLLLAHWQGPTA